MTLAVLLDHLTQIGVVLAVDGRDLKLRGSRAALTAELINEIRAHKTELLARLGACAGVKRGDVQRLPSVVSVPSVPSATARTVPSPTSSTHATPLRTTKDVSCLAALILAAPSVALCVEGGKSEVLAKPRFLHLALPDGAVWTNDLLIGPDIGPVVDALGSRRVLVHDGVGDLGRLAHHHGIRPASVVDTFIAAKLLDGGREQSDRAFELDVLSRTWLGITLPKPPLDWTAAAFPSPAWSAHAGVLPALAEKLAQALTDAKLADTARLEFNLIAVVVEMMLAGIRVDGPAWNALLVAARNQLGVLAPRVTERLRIKHLEFHGDVLAALRQMGLTVEATDKDTLAPYLGIPVVADLIALRHAEAFARGIGTSVSKALQGSHDGRVRCHLRQVGTITGRFASLRPNLLGLPKDTAVRQAFVPADGCVFVVGDYAACQMRIAAAYAVETNLLALFRRGGDPHFLTASLILGKPEDDVTASERTRAKVINFGFLFGMGVDTFIGYALSNYSTVFTREEAEIFRAKFLEAYPAIARWHAATAQPSSESLASAGGRVRYFPGTDFCARLASPVQATEADGIKRAMVRLAPQLRRLGARMLLCIHDELLIEAPQAVAVDVTVLVEREMREAMQELVPDVVIKVDTSVRTTWAAADVVAGPCASDGADVRIGDDAPTLGEAPLDTIWPRVRPTNCATAGRPDAVPTPEASRPPLGPGCQSGERPLQGVIKQPTVGGVGPFD